MTTLVSKPKYPGRETFPMAPQLGRKLGEKEEKERVEEMRLKLEKEEEWEKGKAGRRARRLAKGRGGTLLTGGRGVTETPMLFKKKLLGQ